MKKNEVLKKTFLLSLIMFVVILSSCGVSKDTIEREVKKVFNKRWIQIQLTKVME